MAVRREDEEVEVLEVELEIGGLEVEAGIE